MASPKVFTARTSSYYSRRSAVMILFFVIGLAGIVFGLIAISTQVFGYQCKYDKPISVSVAWDRTIRGSSSSSNNEDQKRYKTTTGFVGIQIGFDPPVVAVLCGRLGSLPTIKV